MVALSLVLHYDLKKGCKLCIKAELISTLCEEIVSQMKL